jgi:hypothetical protein
MGSVYRYKKWVFNLKILLIMKKNMGNADRIIRVIVATLISILCFNEVITGTVSIILMVIAAIFLLTSLVGYCPLYVPLGVQTRKMAKSK